MADVRWLRISYWTGAALDVIAGTLMLFPEAGRAAYGVADFDPAPDYRYAMGLGASLMLGWTLLLLWADRKPLERRGVLPITVAVIAGLAWAGAYALRAGLIPLPHMIASWSLQALLVILFLYSYFRSGRAPVEGTREKGVVSLAEAATEFLAQRRFAVVGVSRAGDAPANFIFKRLKDSGREVYAINPNAETIDGERCYRSLDELPEPPDAVMIVTHPDKATDVARQCKAAGVRHVWFHRSIDGGSYSAEAAALCAGYGATVIPGGCPMMHLPPVDFGHRCMHGMLRWTGKLPKAVKAPNA
jgi:predicted CoA-binding protein